jgi:two-component system phosphate regulon sensor histidine kinase PhoR
MQFRTATAFGIPSTPFCTDGTENGSEERTLARSSSRNQQLLAIALLPAVLLVIALALAGAVDPLAAVAVVAVVAVGGWWFTRQAGGPEPPPPATAESSALPPAAQLVEGFPDPVILLNRLREIIILNRVARDLLGISGTGRDLALSLRHPGVLAAVETVGTGVPTFTEEISLPVPVARTFTLYVGRLDDHGDVAAPAAILVFHDETRAKRAEQSRADFVANASHELRSPLASLIGMIETLRGPAANDAAAQERFLDIMRNEARRMARLIDDLLSLSRVEINEHVPPRTTVDVAEILAGIETTLGIRARERDMRIVIDCAADVPPIAGEADQLIQVFHNLIDNAVKYGRAGTDIRVAARRIAQLPGSGALGVAIAVADEGPGIPAVHLPRITERFYRLDAGRSRKLGGTGLGLAIVKHIVNRHRGQLQIESEEGRGSTFTVLLPAAGAKPEGNVTKA